MMMMCGKQYLLIFYIYAVVVHAINRTAIIGLEIFVEE